ncbi:MMPL family transporter [Cohnella silvisoli]|uniref:MMPL family transporter n=1 Tax=Cohnella silvisoli TaxID=2873699 RepID=A0ABV1L3Y1_9BACL|nr:MMPL family transporter [Cohnella silvisoli]MCD9026341.1 MMPL family transporter [Cohnella silvisoli]
MQRLMKLRWALAVVWVVLFVAAVAFKPDMDALIREKGQPKIPQEYSSIQSVSLLKQLNQTPSDVKPMDIVVVFHEDEQLSSDQMTHIQQQIADLGKKSSELGIVKFTDPFANAQVKSQLIAKDGTTVMLPLTLNKNNKTVTELTEGLQQQLHDSKVQTYVTGNDRITEDQILTSQAGVKKTEMITVIFIIAILILVFRSPVTPILSLLIVGITYVISLSAVTSLVDTLGFPFATTTQTFLLLVLFGIGTDYNILLLSRFKEELREGHGVLEAIAATYRTAGKTVLYSGIAVLIGFSILGLAKFSIYQSAVAVAVGVALLMLVLFTLLPVCMLWTGNILFWPAKRQTGHGDNKLWKLTGTFSISRPIVSLVIVGLLTIPFLLSYKGELSFNSTKEVADSYESIQGLNLLSDKFTPGKAMPSTVVISTDERMDSKDRLAVIDRVSEAISIIQGVEKVYGPTRSKGDKMNGFPDLKGKEFQAVLNAYMSEDRRSFKLTVELAVDPYSAEAMDVIGQIQAEAEKQLRTSGIESFSAGIGGVSSTNKDLRQISNEDFQRSVYLMLIGIFAILLYILRSFWIPLYIILSLVLSYFTALSVTETVAVNVFGADGLSWTAPFFSFIMIMALGVDYSIFLMMRYKEYSAMSPVEAVLQALKRIGGVVISAAVILSGTFAAMYPAGVPSLIQIATIVIVGLALLTFLMLPLFIPALMSLQAKLMRSGDREMTIR